METTQKHLEFRWDCIVTKSRFIMFIVRNQPVIYNGTRLADNRISGFRFIEQLRSSVGFSVRTHGFVRSPVYRQL